MKQHVGERKFLISYKLGVKVVVDEKELWIMPGRILDIDGVVIDVSPVIGRTAQVYTTVDGKRYVITSKDGFITDNESLDKIRKVVFDNWDVIEPVVESLVSLGSMVEILKHFAEKLGFTVEEYTSETIYISVPVPCLVQED